MCEGQALDGHATAATLASGGGKDASAASAVVGKPIQTTVIPDAAAFAVMPRVSKVVISIAAVTLSGQVVVRAGTLALVTAARAHGKPVIGLCSSLKLLPVADASALPSIDASGDPAAVIPFTVAAAIDGELAQQPGRIIAPAWEVLPAPVSSSPSSLVSLIITSAGAGVKPEQAWRVAEDSFGHAG